MAFWRAMRCTANARDRVTVGSRPSGTKATMMPMANTRLSWPPMPTNSQLAKKVKVPIDRATVVIVRTIRATCNSRVLGERRVVAVRWATWPNSVSVPVA